MSLRQVGMKVRQRFSVDNDVTLFFGDCRKLLRGIPDGEAQLVVTSPPYNIGKAYERRRTIADFLLEQEEVIRECVRILKPGGSICWQVGNHVNGHSQIIPLDLLLFPIFMKLSEPNELRLRNRIIWHFEHGLNCKFRFSGRHETILWFTKGNDYTFNLDVVRVPQKYPGKRAYKGPRRGTFSGNPLGKNPGDVWIFPNVKSNHVEKTLHPCQFPVELVERLVLALTSPGNLVVDPFLGTGTTAVAAVLHGRRAAGAEVVEQYLSIAKERVRKARAGQLQYRSWQTPVYQPIPGTALTSSPFVPHNC